MKTEAFSFIKKKCPIKPGLTFQKLVFVLLELVHHVGHDVHDLGDKRTVLANGHHAHIVALDHEEGNRFHRGATARGRSITLGW